MRLGLIFANRNLKEMYRDVLSWIFCIALPLVLLCLCNFVLGNIPNTPPNFLLSNFSGGILIFSFSFIMLFSGVLVSKDKNTSFLKRLYISPMTAKDFVLGYTLSAFPIVLAQVVFVYGFCIVCGMTLSVDILLGVLLSIPSAFMYIGLGLLFGSCFNDKAVSGVSSLFVNVAAILSGMWFDLSMIGQTFSDVMHILPFANAVDVINFASAGLYDKVLLPFIVCLAYAVAIFVLAVVVFNKKSKK